VPVCQRKLIEPQNSPSQSQRSYPGRRCYRLTVRQNYRRSFGFAINLFGKEARTILGDSRELLAGGLGAEIIRRPALLKRMDVTGEVLFSGPDEFQRL
jgi:hypothetical protein